MVTIKEIAEMLGVSTATVSNVIHGKTKKVSKKNIERIEKVLKETKYVNRMDKNALINEKPLIIGVVIHTCKSYENTFLSDPFYGQLVGVLEKEIRKAGYYMMLYASESTEEIYQMVMTWNIAGLVAVTFTHTEYNKLAALIKRPIVAVDLYNILDHNYYNVGTQDKQGGFLMTKYLLDLGYSDILVIGNRNVGVDYTRWQGYEEALKKAEGSRFKAYPLIAASDVYEKRRKQFEELAGFAARNKRTALFFLADILAVEGINFFAEKGIIVPDDVGIAGYDDSQYSSITHPKLTTINQDITIKAKKTCEMLLDLLNGREIEKHNLLLPVRLVIRNSTKNKG